MKQILFDLAVLVLTNVFAVSNNLWVDEAPNSFTVKVNVYLAPVSFRSVSLNKSELANVLNSAPDERNTKVKYSNTIISLPMPNGTMARFKIVESSIMEPELQAKYPDIRTYLGQGIDDPYAVVRFDNTPLGFHAMILSPFGTVFIDPFSMNETEHYISYYKDDFRPAVDKKFTCLTQTKDQDVNNNNPISFRTG